MGKSRSATILLSYLLWHSRHANQSSNQATKTISNDDMVPIPQKPLSVEQALMQLRQGRPIAEPNEGFMEQLYMYVDMGCPTTLAEMETHKLYRRFLNRLKVEESLSANQAPDVLDIRFEDDAESSDLSIEPKAMEEIAPGISAPTGQDASAAPANQPLTQIRCRRCRHVLATTPHIAQHTPSRSDPASQPCAHVFLHPLSWMKGVLGKGDLDGRLSCPGRNCGVNIGKFAWQGMRCSCGGWVTPGFGVVKTKVDEAVLPASKPASAGANAGANSEGASGGAAAIRLPPGMRRGGNL
jgi:dual specificity phosphatase 12